MGCKFKSHWRYLLVTSFFVLTWDSLWCKYCQFDLVREKLEYKRKRFLIGPQFLLLMVHQFSEWPTHQFLPLDVKKRFNGGNKDWLWFCILPIVTVIEICQWNTRLFKSQIWRCVQVKVSLSRCFPCFVCFPNAVLLACVCFLARNWGIPISCPLLL